MTATAPTTRGRPRPPRTPDELRAELLARPVYDHTPHTIDRSALPGMADDELACGCLAPCKGHHHNGRGRHA